MARIRTIKPEFFRHEGLQDLERDNPGMHPMLVFAGLFGHCDKGGVFEWKPRTLKLDILPFLDFDMAETLELLRIGGHVQRFEHGGKSYGFIPSFTDHQSIGGKEAQSPVKFPRPDSEAAGKERGSAREVSETAGREGKGREQEGNGTYISRARGNPDPKVLAFDDRELMDRFAIVMSVYPKRTGLQDGIADERAWRNRVDEGVPFDELEAGAKRYAAYCAAGGVSSPKFVMAMRRFYGDASRPWRQTWEPPASKAESLTSHNLDVGAEFMRRTEPA